MRLKTKIILFLSLLIGQTVLSAQTVRIMPLGDSITYDDLHSDYPNPRPKGVRHGYRNHLWYMLKDAGYDVNFVGTRIAGEDIVPAFDPDNEGHPGWTSYDIAEHILNYLNYAKPDTVLLHIGTNDGSTSTRGVESILNEIDQYERDSGQRVLVLVALIIDRQVHDPIITVFNNRLIKLISRRRQSGDIVTLVNMYKDAGILSSEYADNTHPTDAGYQKMAKVWFNAIQTPYRPFNTSLKSYPTSLVNSSYIISTNVNEATNTVTFKTEIPKSGIKF